MANAFEPVSPPAWITLFWVHELQRLEVATQNMLAKEQCAVTSGLIEAMQIKLVDYNNFVILKN